MTARATWPQFNAAAFHVVERIRLSPAEFNAMRIAERPNNLPAPPMTLCRVLIDGRWHACDRQYQCGMAVYFARPIVIVLERAAVPA